MQPQPTPPHWPDRPAQPGEPDQPELFAAGDPAPGAPVHLRPQFVLLPGYALAQAPQLLQAVERIAAQAPLRHMVTPGGYEMSVALTNCGALGWTTDRRGYRYTAHDPATGQPWPPMPPEFADLARAAAGAAGFPAFEPDACLINAYAPGSRLSMHQDRNEASHAHPVVSVSLGLPATFLYAPQRQGRPERVVLQHGDVVVWGGADRLMYHGIAPLRGGTHPLLGERRINFTFRRAGA